jgi:hypothetical protein
MSLVERLWARVKITDTCWLWMGSHSTAGYGTITVDSKAILVHRLAYELTFGPIPDGLWVLHRCDTPACVRPVHLFLGTRTDNMQDMVRKGRHWVHTRPERIPRGAKSGARLHPERVPRGEKTTFAKLTAEQVREIRHLQRNGTLSQQAIGDMFGVSHSAISSIIHRKTWRHVPDN